jgi:hypothetical protein
MAVPDGSNLPPGCPSSTVAELCPLLCRAGADAGPTPARWALSPCPTAGTKTVNLRRGTVNLLSGDRTGTKATHVDVPATGVKGYT